jgi:hypothetical protein
MSNKGYVYIILPREFRRQRENVVKIGCTNDFINRFSQYPKGSLGLYFQYVDDCRKEERKIIQALKENFIHRKDLGKEYFEGSLKHIVHVVHETVEIFEQVYDDDEDVLAVDEEIHDTKITDPQLIVEAFMDEYKPQLNNQIIRSANVYDLFNKWTLKHSSRIGRNISHARFTRSLKEAYGIESKPYRFEDGVSQGIIFGDIANAKGISERSFEDFIAKYIKKNPEKYFTLKDMKKVYQSSEFFDVKDWGKLKQKLEIALNTKAFEQKKIKYQALCNVYMGYELKE